VKRIFFYLTLLLVLAAPLKAETVSFNQFSGLNSDDSPLTLQNGQTPDSENVITDDGPGLQGRKGFTAYSTETVTGSFASLWEFPLSNGTRYLIEASGGRMKATTAGGFTVNISTIPTDRLTVGTPLGDRFYFANTTDGLKYWDGASVTVASTTMKVDKLVTWKGRLAAAGIAAAPRVIYLSKYLDGTNFTAPTNPSDDDAAIITVAGALDENIQALYSSFQDKLVWMKKNSFGAIYGSRRSNFAQRTFSDFIGVSSPETIRDCDGVLRWLGSNRMVWEFDGSTFKKISEQVDTIFAGISQGDSSSRVNTQTSQADWVAGSQSPSGFGDTTVIVGSLTPKTSTFLDTLQSDFQGGTCDPTDSCDTTLSSGSLSAKISTITWTDATDWGAGAFDNTLFVDTETVAGNLQTTFPETCSGIRDGSSGSKRVWISQSNGSVSSTVVAGACVYTAGTFCFSNGVITYTSAPGGTTRQTLTKNGVVCATLDATNVWRDPSGAPLGTVVVYADGSTGYNCTGEAPVMVPPSCTIPCTAGMCPP